METIKSYTDIEQSKKLAEILPFESADMYYNRYEDPYFINVSVTHERIKNDKYHHLIPCWSLAALRNLLPPAIKINKNTYLFESHNTFDKSWVYRYYNEDGASHLYCKNTNEVDACYELILKLNKLNLL